MESIKTKDEAKFQQQLTRFFAGILLYSLTTGLVCCNIPGIPAAVLNAIQLAALIIYAFYWIKLASFKNIPGWYLKISAIFLVAWQCYIIHHGFIFNYPYLKEYLFTPDRCVQYLVPLVVFIPINHAYFLQNLFTWIYKLGVFFLISFPFLFIFLISQQSFSEQYIWALAISSGFTLLTSFYHTKKRVIVAGAVMLMALFLATIMARRNIMLSCALFLLCATFIGIFINQKFSVQRKIAYAFLLLLVSAVGYYFFVSNQSGMFSKITERATEDTREGVLLFYFLDMDDPDYVIGKGLNGTYYCPGIDAKWMGSDLDYRDLDYRFYIECGYLQLLLNGGVVYIVLFLLVLLPAIVLGLGFSKNIFSKGCALLILLWLIDMVPFGLPAFTLRYFIVWFCVFFCFSKEIRKMSNEQIKDLLTPKSVKV